MKRFLVFAAFCAIACGAVFGQRTIAIKYRPFEWAQIVLPVPIPGSPGDTCTVEMYFPNRMARIARQVVPEIEATVGVYAERFNCMLPRYKPPPDDTEVFEDSTGAPQFERRSWHPKSLCIVLYPTMEEYGQQEIIPFAIPPGVLGFTEMEYQRVSCPYGGNWWEFTETVRHEMAHAWMTQFIKDRYEMALDVSEETRGGIADPPLWFSEGFAEFMADRNLGYRRARAEEVNVWIALHDKVPTLADLEDMNGFAVYTLGYSVLSFVAHTAGDSSLMDVLGALAHGTPFPEAWMQAFGRTLSATALEWREWRRLLGSLRSADADADIAPHRAVTLPFAGNVRIAGTAAYQPQTGMLSWYQPSDKWGLVVKVASFADGRVGDVTHQFHDRSRFLRFWCPPAFCDSSVAVVALRDGHPVVERFGIAPDPDDPTRFIVSPLSATAFPRLIGITDIAFVSHDSLLCIGVDSAGQKDVYAWSAPRGALRRLTDDPSDKQSLTVTASGALFIEGGGSEDRRSVRRLSPSGDERYSFAAAEFIDQIVADPAVAVLRFISPKGIPGLLVWRPGSARAYRYRHGMLSPDDSSKVICSPLIATLAGVSSSRGILFATSDGKFHESEQFVAAKPDTA